MSMLSIVVPHYGHPGAALSLVSQLQQQQDAGVDLQIIVVDDFSPTPFPSTAGVEVVRRSTNGGFGSAVNAGAARARGEALLILNSDLDVPADFVAQMVRAAERFPGAVLSPRVVRPDGRLEWTGRAFPRIHHQAVEWLTAGARWRDSDLWHRAVGHDLRTREGDTEVDWVIGAAMFIPTTAFQSAGGFDSRFFMNCEEVDLQRRLREMRVPSIALASPVVLHVGGGSSPSLQRRRWVVESRLQYAAKWGGQSRLRAALLAATGINLAWNTARRLAGRDVHPVRTFKLELGLACRARAGSTERRRD